MATMTRLVFKYLRRPWPPVTEGESYGGGYREHISCQVTSRHFSMDLQVNHLTISSDCIEAHLLIEQPGHKTVLQIGR